MMLVEVAAALKKKINDKRLTPCKSNSTTLIAYTVTD
jgi:hypothetical protein